MSDGKRRRFRKTKEEKRPVILAKRDTERFPSGNNNSIGKATEEPVQPKILLKTKPAIDKEVPASNATNNPTSTTTNIAATTSVTLPQKPVIVTRDGNGHSPLLIGQSPNVTKEAGDGPQQPQQLLHEPTPQMTRPATVISSTSSINSNARKFLLKTNTDFFVVGVIGTQGVGKSTVMNLLANDDPQYDYYTKVFKEEDSIFPIKMKTHKCSACSRTESTHLFITKDRMILLDTPPVLSNSYLKDMSTNELDDIRNLITMLSICHLVIVVQDDYFNINLIRLLQFAELTKPNQDNKPFVTDFFPNVLFVKNRAKRHDYMPGQKERMDNMLKYFFMDSQLKVFVGQTDRLKKGKLPDSDRIVNSFLIPEIKDNSSSSYRPDLDEIVNELRQRVFMTSRNQIYNGPTELTEAIWFELLMKVSNNTQHFFFNTYEEIHRKHLDTGNTKDNHDMWSEKQ